MPSLWHEAASKTLSERYHQNFLLCHNNKITACIIVLFHGFCEEVYAVVLFKVMQQQTIGEVGNSITFYEQIISICKSKRIIKIRQYLRKLCSNEKGSSFFDSQCMLHIWYTDNETVYSSWDDFEGRSMLLTMTQCDRPHITLYYYCYFF